jgi:hypothetical protein
VEKEQRYHRMLSKERAQRAEEASRLHHNWRLADDLLAKQARLFCLSCVETCLRAGAELSATRHAAKGVARYCMRALMTVVEGL